MARRSRPSARAVPRGALLLDGESAGGHAVDPPGVAQAPAARVVSGRLRVAADPRTLAARARPGDVALLGAATLPAADARALRDRGVAAVLLQGEPPGAGSADAGALLLLDAGLPVGRLLADAAPLRPRRLLPLRRAHWGGTELRYGKRSVAGRALDHDEERDRAQAALARDLASAGGAADHAVRALVAGGDLLLGHGEPEIGATALRGRPCLVVDAGAEADLRRLRGWRRRARPVAVVTSGGAAAALAAGLRPDLLVGDLAAVPEEALACAGELVALTGGTAWDGGVARVTAGGRAPHVVDAVLDPVTVALLLARTWEAPLAVVAGGGTSTDRATDAVRALAGLRAVGAAELAQALPPPRRGRVAAVAAAVVLAPAAVVLSAPPHGWASGLHAALGRVTAAATGLVGHPATRPLARPRIGRDAGHDASSLAVSGDAVAAAVGPALVVGALAGHRVLLVATPGADPATVASVAADLDAAGAASTDRLDVAGALLRPADRVLRSALADRLAAGPRQASGDRPGRRQASGEDPGLQVLVGALGNGLLTRTPGHLGRPPSGRTVTLLAGLAAAGALQPVAAPPRRADVAVLVSGAADDQTTTAALAAGLATHAAATVVVGPADGGAVRGVRAGTAPAAVASVDDPVGPLGRLTVVRAVLAALSGHPGAFGTGQGATALLPAR